MLFGWIRSRRQRAGRRGLALRAAGVLALLCLWPALPARAQAPDTLLPIVNRVDVTYRSVTGIPDHAHDESRVRLRLRPGLSLSTADPALICGGESHVFTHILKNVGNGPDRITLEAIQPDGTRGTLLLDADGDGAPGGADPEITGELTLAKGDSVVVFLRVETDATLADVALGVVLRARSGVNPALVVEVEDRLEFCAPPPELEVEQQVDRALVTAGDTLLFSFQIANTGHGTSTAAVLVDTLPASVRFLDGSLVRDSVALAAGEAGYDLETLEDERQLLRVPLDTIDAGGGRGVAFRAVVVADSSVATITNRAHATERDRTTESNEVEVVFELPAVDLQIQILGRSTVYAGDEVTFELRYENTSGVRAVNAVLVNTLPVELRYLSATPSPSQPRHGDAPSALSPRMVSAEAGGPVNGTASASPTELVWELGTLVPGETGTILVHTILDSAPRDGRTELVNRASLSAGTTGYSVVVAAVATPIAVEDLAAASIDVRKTAGRLEVSLGDPVPYLIEVENTGDVPLHDVLVRDFMGEALALVADGVTGVDSLRVEGDEVRLHIPGPLAPGATYRVRYAAIATEAPGEAVANRAVAEAEAGRVVSDTATAWVRVRRGPSLPARTLIGKVWVDHDGDGRQGPEDAGLAGVDLWTTDGQVVRTDEEGRFSIQDLEPGRYTLRLDMLGLEAQYEVAERGGDVKDVRMDGWTMGRVDFRLVPRRVLVDHHAAPPPEVLARLEAARQSAAKGAGIVTVVAARTEEARAADRRREIVAGPGVVFFSPEDGRVVASSRTYIGVRGEAGRPVELIGEDGVLREGTIRPDGVLDFIAVELERGPNRFVARMTNSWGTVREDSMVIHRSGEPASFEVDHAPDRFRAESPVVDTLRVRVLDAWGVPVVTSPFVTVIAEGLSVEGRDADRSSVGLQLRADSVGWLNVPVRARGEAGPARIALQAGEAGLELAARVMPPIRPLFATMSGRIGLGGAEEGTFAAITARGALDENTSLTLSYDSRRGDDDMAAFGRAYDPLSETLYPTTGDRSQRRVLSGSDAAFSARVERGQDWIAFGDVRTDGFAGTGQLTRYDRAFSGVSGRYSMGSVVWHGFGSATGQRLAEVQLRGEGSSGPYSLGGRIRPGTELLAIEVRAHDNTARVISRTELNRFVDYQIDYRTGEVLLNRLLPAMDAHGNAMFLVASVERLDADERHWVGGVRMELDASDVFSLAKADSVGFSLFGIHDGAHTGAAVAGATNSELLGGEVFARIGESRVGLELLHASADSTGMAGRASLEWSPLRDRVRLRGEWMSVGDGFSSRQNPRLRSGLEEFRVGSGLRLREDVQLQLDHDRQTFRAFDVERRNSRARVEHTRGERAVSLEGGLIQEWRNGAATGNALLTRATAALSPDVTVWAENRHALEVAQSTYGSAQTAAGISVRLLERARIEGQHRRIAAETPYSLTSVMLNLDSWKGGRVWGGMESADGAYTHNGVSLGWDQKLDLPAGWSLSSQLERRFGLDDASLGDPVRALPFPQVERDRLSAGLGVQWRGGAGTRFFSARGEYTDGDLINGYRIEALGDMDLGKDAALLMRHDWLRNERLYGPRTTFERRDHSLLGIAFRPSASNTLNALAKVEWRRTVRPDGFGDPTLAGDNARLIGAADLAWTPEPSAQAVLRYAIRGNRYENPTLDDLVVHSRSHFVGSSLERRVHGRVFGRLDGRALHVTTTGDTRWSLAPALVIDFSEIELEAGYRAGNLRDIDFGGRGGLGFFASIGVRLTERNAAGIAEFWRHR